MAVRLPPSSRADALQPTAALPLSAVLAICLPILSLHVDYQPGFTISLGSASPHIVLSDFAVAAVALAGLVSGVRHGFGALRAGWPIWVTGGLFLAMVLASSAYPRLWTDRYDWAEHAVSAAKFAEYVLVALAVPLLVRDRRDLDLLLTSLVAWSSVATVVAIAQVFGADILDAYPPGRRQPSFLGHHDFAALSGATLSVAVAGIAVGRAWRPGGPMLVAAGLAGGLGVVLSGSSAGAIGLAVAAGATLLVAWRRAWLSARRALAATAVVGVVCLGVVVLRAGDLNQFLRFVGVRSAEVERQNVQTYVHRTLLAYIGWRVFLADPVAGAGWQASAKEPSAYEPYLADARREFPEAPPLAFPSPEHPWGVQSAYIQALADTGAIGFALLVALLLSGIALAGRAALRAPPETAVPGLIALAWLLVAAGVWTAVGLVAGLPLDALTWLSLGLAAAAAAGARLARI